MSKLSFRARALDASKPMPVYLAEELPDLPDYSAINRAVPQMPSGMEKEEECEHHLQRAICTGLIIPTPLVADMADAAAYDRLYPPDYRMPRTLIHMQPLGLEQDVPDYDMDSEDERWLKRQQAAAGSRRCEITELKFEEMMERLERSSGQTVVTLQEARLLAGRGGPAEHLLAAVYDYWLNKRLATQQPLLLAVKTEARPGAPAAAASPYLAFRRRTEKMQTRKNRKNDESSYEKMVKLRRELSRAVSLLDLIKRREKTKRELLRLAAALVEKRYAARDFSGHLLAEAAKATVAAVPPVIVPAYVAPHHRPTVADPTTRQREKRQYKRRKHRHHHSTTVLPPQNLHHVPVSGSSSSSEGETIEIVPPPTDLSGPFAFRRKPGCLYHMPTASFGPAVDVPWRTGRSKENTMPGDQDQRLRYSLTSLRHPSVRCIGLARRRLGRGGRVILDRLSTPEALDRLWATMDYTLTDSGANSLPNDPHSTIADGLNKPSDRLFASASDPAGGVKTIDGDLANKCSYNDLLNHPRLRADQGLGSGAPAFNNFKAVNSLFTSSGSSVNWKYKDGLFQSDTNKVSDSDGFNNSFKSFLNRSMSDLANTDGIKSNSRDGGPSDSDDFKTFSDFSDICINQNERQLVKQKSDNSISSNSSNQINSLKDDGVYSGQNDFTMGDKSERLSLQEQIERAIKMEIDSDDGAGKELPELQPSKICARKETVSHGGREKEEVRRMFDLLARRSLRRYVQPRRQPTAEQLEEVFKDCAHFRPQSPPASSGPSAEAWAPEGQVHLTETAPITVHVRLSLDDAPPSDILFGDHSPFVTNEFTLSDLYGDSLIPESDNLNPEHSKHKTLSTFKLNGPERLNDEVLPAVDHVKDGSPFKGELSESSSSNQTSSVFLSSECGPPSAASFNSAFEDSNHATNGVNPAGEWTDSNCSTSELNSDPASVDLGSSVFKLKPFTNERRIYIKSEVAPLLKRDIKVLQQPGANNTINTNNSNAGARLIDRKQKVKQVVVSEGVEGVRVSVQRPGSQQQQLITTSGGSTPVLLPKANTLFTNLHRTPVKGTPVTSNPPPPQQPQLVTVAVTEALKLRLQGHLTQTRDGLSPSRRTVVSLSGAGAGVGGGAAGAGAPGSKQVKVVHTTRLLQQGPLPRLFVQVRRPTNDHLELANAQPALLNSSGAAHPPTVTINNSVAPSQQVAAQQQQGQQGGQAGQEAGKAGQPPAQRKATMEVT